MQNPRRRLAPRIRVTLASIRRLYALYVSRGRDSIKADASAEGSFGAGEGDVVGFVYGMSGGMSTSTSSRDGMLGVFYLEALARAIFDVVQPHPNTRDVDIDEEIRRLVRRRFGRCLRIAPPTRVSVEISGSLRRHGGTEGIGIVYGRVSFSFRQNKKRNIVPRDVAGRGAEGEPRLGGCGRELCTRSQFHCPSQWATSCRALTFHYLIDAVWWLACRRDLEIRMLSLRCLIVCPCNG
ncbi:hypothetical protein R3P38DRAFT_322202 [Favolaschia claudopus]|uniref:Uncharacterized protein n=1 Tax=Favolaschia claudopus TaxID=2862362 RepID=A0AAW0CUQ5_9AGAR